MSLSVIVGPPNSGKAGEVLARLKAALDRDPVLIVPTLDDADRFERELCEGAGNGDPVLGVSIRTFERLFEDVAQATGTPLPPTLSDEQRLYAVRLATRRANPRILGRSAARPGFARALASLLDEAQAACIDPAGLAASAAAVSPQSAYLREIAALYTAYAETRDTLGYGDDHVAAARATAALRTAPDAWSARPVLVYGFDDLTVEQLELLSALAEASEVTVSVAYEDRDAFVARAHLHQELRERGGESEPPLEPNPANTVSQTLFRLERCLLRERTDRIEPDDGLVRMEAAGERGQAEQIGGQIARLLADGVKPGEIAVVLRSPDRHGPLYESVLAGFGVPVAVEASVPATRTAVGRGLISLLRGALTSRRAEDVLAFVRTPGVAHAGDADWLERTMRRRGLQTAAEALEAWTGRRLFEFDELAKRRQPEELLRVVAGLARRIGEQPHERRAPLAALQERLELRAASVAAEAVEALAEMPGIEDPAREALATLEGLEVPLWRGPTEGHVRVTSPYRIRARRVTHLFVASLQEGEFPRHDAGEPFLSDEQRGALGLPPRARADDEERYLFHVCLSRPTRRLYLCWRSCDDEGAEAARSPFLDDVRDLLAPPPPSGGDPDPLDRLVLRRRLGDVTFPPGEAPSIDELARSLAASAEPGHDRAAAAPELGLDPDDARRLAARLEAVAARVRRKRLEPGPLSVPAVLDELQARKLFGASTLEEYALCSYRWFVQHELTPQTLEPAPEALTQGSAIHAVLEQLYRDPPGGAPSPRPQTLDDWRRRASELIASEAAEHGLGADDARGVTSRARMAALIDGFLEREAAASLSVQPDRELIEASFGEGEHNARPPLELDGFGLHGKIDRVDVPASGEPTGLIRDYKVSRTVTTGANLEKEGKLQPQLYALALEQLWGRRPLGGLYQPLAGTDSHRPRGIARAAEADGPLSGLDLYPNDLLDEDDFEAALNDAAARARAIVAAMRGGEIDRNPIDDRCPPFCTFQGICRRERAARIEPEPGDDEDEVEAE